MSRLKGNIHQLLLTGPSLAMQATPEVWGQLGPKTRTSPDQPYGALSLLTLGILCLNNQLYTCCPGSTWIPPQTVPVFVLSHYTQYLDKKYSRSLGCQTTELSVFLAGVWRLQPNSENWGLSKPSDRHINLDHQRAMDPRQCCAHILSSTQRPVKKMKLFWRQSYEAYNLV